MATEDSVLLEWTYQMNGSSPRTGLDIEIRRNNTLERTVAIAASSTSTELTNLSPLRTYSVTAYVESSVGRSRPSFSNVSTLSLRKY